MIKYAIFENLDKAKSILKSKEIPLTDPVFMDIKKKLEKANRLGYIGWIIGLLYDKNQSKDDVLGIVDTISLPAIKETSTWFTKPITDIESTEEFTDQLNRARNRKLAKNMWLKFPLAQKNLLNWEDSEIESLLVRLWDAKYDNLLKKISSYKTESDLLNQIKYILSGKMQDSFEYFVNLCINNNIKILHKSEENNIIITQVLNYSEVCILAQDSSWCIRNKSSFEWYTNPEDFYGIKIPKIQTIIINTDELGNYRKIGATIGTQIKSAHLWNDERISESGVIEYVKGKGFDMRSLFIKIDTDEINEEWIEEKLKNKIDFTALLSIITTFKVEIKKRLKCWKYINVGGVLGFYNEEELMKLSKDILFLKYFTEEISRLKFERKGFRIPEFFSQNSRFLINIFEELLECKIQKTNVPVSDEINDVVELVKVYFGGDDINRIIDKDLLFVDKEYLIYSKNDLIEKYRLNNKIKTYIPLLGDVKYISDKKVKYYARSIEEDIVKNLFKYHKAGFETIGECLDKFCRLVKYYDNYLKKEVPGIRFESIVVPPDQSKKEIFDAYFKEVDFRQKYNYHDMLNISDKELLDNIGKMPTLLEPKSPFTEPILDRIIDVCGNYLAIKYMFKSDFDLELMCEIRPNLFLEAIDIIKSEGTIYNKKVIGLKSLEKLNKKQLVEIISSDNFQIDLDDIKIRYKLTDFNLDPAITTKHYSSFKGDVSYFLGLYYEKSNYKLFKDIIYGHYYSRTNRTSDLNMCECALLNKLDGNCEIGSDLESIIDTYLRTGEDEEIKSKIQPIKEDFIYSYNVRKRPISKSELSNNCDKLLERPEKVKKYWSDIVVKILSSVEKESNTKNKNYYSYLTKEQKDKITKEFAEEQVERFKDLVPSFVDEKIFRSNDLEVVWKMIKPGCLYEHWRRDLDAYMTAQILLSKDPKTKMEKTYEFYKKIYSDKKSDYSLPSYIDRSYEYCFKNIDLGTILDFIDSIPNDRVNKKSKQHLVSAMFNTHRLEIYKKSGYQDFESIEEYYDLRFVKLASSILNKGDRIFLGLEKVNRQNK
jgi:hypothetical protein